MDMETWTSRHGGGNTKRREIKDKSSTLRIGPAPVTDSVIKSKKTESTSPGSLDSDMEDIEFTDGEQISKAGCKALLMYFSKLGKTTEDQCMDLDLEVGILHLPNSC